MIRLPSALALLVLTALPAGAQGPTVNMPPNTVWGRLGIPSNGGPGQSIPFQVLINAIAAQITFKPTLPPGTAFYVNPSGSTTSPCGPTGGRVTCQPGSDGSNCISANTPCQTWGAIITTKLPAYSARDMNPHSYLADGTYNENVVCFATPAGASEITVVGNSATPANVVLNSQAGGAALDTRDGCILQLDGMRVQGAGSQGIHVEQMSVVDMQNMDWGGIASGVHIQLDVGGYINDTGGTWTISGSSIFHIENNGGIFKSPSARNVALPNSITFTDFIYGVGHAETLIGGLWTFTGAGSCTAGAKYSVAQFSLLNLSGTTLPCPTSGSTTSPAIVVP